MEDIKYYVYVNSGGEGSLGVWRGVYGPEFSLPHLAGSPGVGGLDLYNRIPGEDNPYCQFIFFPLEASEEPLVKIKYYDNGKTEVVVSRGTEVVWE